MGAVKCSLVWWGIQQQGEEVWEYDLLFDSWNKSKLVYCIKSDWEIWYKGKLVMRLI